MLSRALTSSFGTSHRLASGIVVAAVVIPTVAVAVGHAIFHAQPVVASQSQYSATVLTDSPSDYWPVDEGSGTVAHELGVGSRDLTFTNTLNWIGSGLVSGSNSAVQGACSNSCQPAWLSGVPAPVPATRSEEIWFLSPSGSSPVPQGLISIRQPHNGSGGCSEDHTDVLMEPNPNIRVDSLNCSIGEFATDCQFGQNGVPNVLDKTAHLIDVIENAGAVSIYVDGGLCVTGSGVNSALTAPDCVAVGATECSNGTFVITGDSVIGQAAIYPYALAPSQISSHFAAGQGASKPGAYLPSVNGYFFQNPGGAGVTVPDIDRMVSFYPDSRFEIEYPVFNTPTHLAKWFNKNLWISTYKAGLCYGMVTSSQFLFSNFPGKSTVALFQDFTGAPNTFPDGLGASPSPADVTIEQFIDRYHSRQLAAAGALSSIGSWKDTQLRGNNLTFAQIEADVASGQTEWVGLGPSRAVLTEGPDPKANAKRWWFLYNASHAVLAYRADQAAGRIFVYDPNSASDDQAFIELKNSSINPGGGILLVHHGDDSIQANLSYGGGGDLGQPGEWSLMPLPAASFSEQGSVPFESNRKWVLDAAGPIAVIAGATIPTFLGVPIFLMSGSTNAPSESEFLPAGSGLNETITAARPNSSTSEQSGSHVVDVIQTESTAAGTTHQVSISADASAVSVSSASSAQQYSVMFAADFVPSFGRSMTVSGVNLVPSATLQLGADQSYSSLNLSASSMSAQQAILHLEQAAQGAGSATVTVTVPGGGSRGTVFVDWTGIGASLIFEVVTGPSGQVTGILLQDNPGQRQQLTSTLLANLQSEINQVSDAGIRNSLQAKLHNASTGIAAGDPGAAANVLVAFQNEVADQTGAAITPDQAASFNASLSELVGLLRVSVV